MATYLVLIYGDEQRWAAMSAAEEEQLMAGHRALAAAAGDAILHTGEVGPPSSAITLRADCPSATGEGGGALSGSSPALGGYYLLEADGDAEVRALVALLHETRAGHGGVEIRRLEEA